MHCPYRLCITSCPFIRVQHRNPQVHSSMRIAPQPNFISVITKQIKDQKPYIQSDLKIPVFQGIANTNIQTTINNSIQSDVMEFKKEMEEAAQEYGNKAAQKKEPFTPYKISTVYQLTYNKNNVISLSMIYYEYVKGLNHYIKTSYNFDTTTGKSLMLKDIFVPGVDYKSLINQEIRSQLIKNKQKYAPETSSSFKGIAEDQPFYLQNGNLVVFFGFNEIAPTEAEIPVFTIPLSHFGNAVKPRYR